MIERLSKAMGPALLGNNFSSIPSKILFHMKTKIRSHSQKYTNHYNLFDSLSEPVSQEW